MGVPYISFSNDELKDNEPLQEQEPCPNCGEMHEVKYGEVVLEDGTRRPSNSLAFVSCGEQTYLVGIGGKKVEFPRDKASDKRVIL